MEARAKLRGVNGSTEGEPMVGVDLQRLLDFLVAEFLDEVVEEHRSRKEVGA